MEIDINTAEGRRAAYDFFRTVLHDFADKRAEHEQAEPGCEARPLCMGGKNLLALSELLRLRPDWGPFLNLVAVGEILSLRRSLAAARDVSVAQLVVVEQATLRADAAEDRARDLELRCADLQAQVDAWDDCADILAPIPLPPED